MNSFSYSMISTYLRCPALFKMLYIDKIKPEEPENLALHFGTALHAGLNATLEGGESKPVFDAYWASLKGTAFAKNRHSATDLQNMGHVFLDRFERLHKPHYEFIKGEERLYGTIEAIQIEGTLDALVKYKGKLTLMDFKTSSMRYGDSKAMTSMQLALYAHLAEQNLGVKIEQIGYTVFIKTKEPTIQVQLFELDRKWLAAMLTNIKNICLAIQKTGVYYKNYDTYEAYGRHCPACKESV